MLWWNEGGDILGAKGRLSGDAVAREELIQRCPENSVVDEKVEWHRFFVAQEVIDKRG